VSWRVDEQEEVKKRQGERATLVEISSISAEFILAAARLRRTRQGKASRPVCAVGCGLRATLRCARAQPLDPVDGIGTRYAAGVMAKIYCGLWVFSVPRRRGGPYPLLTHRERACSSRA